jgi:DNA-binding transcriptional MocR family regulator
MTSSPCVNLPVVSPGPPDPYDVPDADTTGDLMQGEPSSIAEVTAALRREIYAHRGEPGERFRTREDIAAENGMSAESAGVALRRLAGEGLVVLEQGRGTFLAALTDYRVTVSADAPADARPAQRATAAIRRAELAEPSVTGLERDATAPRWVWTMTVRAADAGRAAVTGLATARNAAGPGAWKFSDASVTAEPAV